MTSRPLLSVLAGVLLLAAPAFAQDPYTYKSLDVWCDPSALTCPAGLAPGAFARQTSAKDINARGDIVGFYVDTAGVQHGFLLSDGQYTTIDVPFAGARGTVANGINAEGEVVGTYLAPLNSDPTSPLYCPTSADAACTKGFYFGYGTFQTVTYSGHPGAIPEHITNDGDIYGCLHDQNTGPSMFGAVWKRSFGPKQSVQISSAISLQPNDGELTDPVQMLEFPTGISMSMNNAGTPGGAQTIAGLFVAMDGRQHGYLVQNGALQTYDPFANVGLTAIWGMSATQQLVGTYRLNTETGARRHGFTHLADGPDAVTVDFSTIDADGNVKTAFATIAYGVNPSGVIVGQYAWVLNGPLHGFIAIPN
jgi:probable HAF family extracellular repeat protein